MNMFYQYKRSTQATFALLFTLFALLGAKSALAATTPSLGAADTYGVLSSTYTDTSAATVVNGDVGFTTPPATVIGGTHTNYGSGAPYSTAGTDQGTALSSLAGQGCTFTFPGGAINLSTDTTHGTAGTYGPGVYCGTGAFTVGGPLTLSGSGTYIFRTTSALNSTAGAVVSITGGASACNVFWTPGALTTFGANTTFYGTVIDDSGITVGANTTWTGRALAFGGTVTTDTDTITVPVCASPSTLSVVKTVVNDNGGTNVITDFPLFVNGSLVTTGVANTYAAGTYTVTETSKSTYTSAFSGDCDSTGHVTLAPGDAKVCVITNNDVAPPAPTSHVIGSSGGGSVPPLIDLIKIPSPLALPNGAGIVTYTYTVKNIGSVPINNVLLKDDSCGPTTSATGDINNDSILQVGEVWTYTCSTNLSATHTNTAVASGWSNGISATDIAIATVVVGRPVVAPLIHITKVPQPLALTVSGGTVTYTEKISNPGNTPISNIRLNDDKCSPVRYILGDTNGDSKLDPNEVWTFLCQTNLFRTTTNTAVVTGEANGLIVRDFAIATVVVPNSLPLLPNTGIAPVEPMRSPIVVFVAGVLALLTTGFYVLMRKQVQ